MHGNVQSYTIVAIACGLSGKNWDIGVVKLNDLY
jgi:hypothetical protein